MTEEETLQDVHPDNTFKLNTGKEIKNLKQLLHVLKDISPDSFAHHVNDDKNDFANWIRDSVKDEELADMMERTTDFDKTKELINDRIALLDKKIEIKQIKKSLDELRSDSMGIEEEPLKEPDKPDLSEPMPVSDSPASLTPDIKPAEPPKNFTTNQPAEHHPFEHLKRSTVYRVLDILIGVIIGVVIGYVMFS